LPEDINAKMRSISSGVNLSDLLPDMLLMPFLSVSACKLKNSSNSAKWLAKERDLLAGSPTSFSKTKANNS